MESVIAAFLNDRAIRAALGFPFDRCLSLGIPPCRLIVDHGFRDRLGELFDARRRRTPLVRTDAQTGVSVSLKFWWRFQRLTMKVTTPTHQRCHYMYTSEYVSTESEGAQWIE
jgi:hypothetical protein